MLEHRVVKLAESEAEAAAHLGQADRELSHRRPVQAWIRWALSSFANLDEVVVFIVFFWKNLHLELRRAVSTGWRRDIVESSSGLHSLQTGISSRALTNIYFFGWVP